MCRPATFTNFRIVSSVAAFVAILLQSSSAAAQSTFGSPAEAPQTNLAPIRAPAGGTSYGTPPANYGAPNTPFPAPSPYSNTVPYPNSATGSGLGPSGFGQFDPYAPPATGGFGGGTAVGNGATTIGPPIPAPTLPPASAGGVGPSPPGGSLFSRIFSQPASSPMARGYGSPAPGPVLTSPGFGSPGVGTYDNPNVYGPPVTYGPPGAATYPGGVYPSSTPSTLFPTGVFGGGAGGYGGSSFFEASPVAGAFRLFQGPRFQNDYILGGNGVSDLNEYNMDVSAVFAFPNFCYSTQPLLVIPSFSLSLWDGPAFPVPGADLPSKAYSAFLDTGWQSDLNQMFGTEFGVRVGVFSDFDTANSDSLRVLGRGLVHFRLTPTTTVKGGVYYLDRNFIKLVPAFGFLCRPNPYSRYDIFFPQPKVAKYLSTVGTQDLWWYLAGDYGGGTWTITRRNGAEDSIDINEYEVLLGLEWGNSESIRQGRRTGFIEIGYVFDREVRYANDPADDFSPGDGFLFGFGIGY